MNLRFASAKPAIEQFNASMTAGDQERRQREQDFAARLARERQRGAGVTLNEGINAFFAAQPAAAPAPAPVGAPMAPAASPQAPIAGPVTPPAPLPMPGQPAPTGGGVPAPFTTGTEAAQSMEPAPASLSPEAAAILAPGGQAPAGAAAAPATASTPPQGSPITGFAAKPRQPAAGLSDRPGFRAMMDKLTSNPDTSGQAMQLFTADLNNQATLRKERTQSDREGIVAFAKALDGNDLQMARIIAQRYDLGIPPEILNSREGLAGIAAASRTAKSLGITDDMAAMRFAQVYLEGTGSGLDQRTAATRAMEEAQKSIRPKVAGHYFGADNAPVLYGQGGENIQQPGKPLPKGRPPREAGGGSKLTLSRQDMVEALVAIGWDRKSATEAAYGVAKNRGLTEAQKASLARQLFTADQQQLPSRRKFESLEDAKAIVDGMYETTGAPSGGAPAPGATAKPRGGGKPRPSAADFDK